MEELHSEKNVLTMNYGMTSSGYTMGEDVYRVASANIGRLFKLLKHSYFTTNQRIQGIVDLERLLVEFLVVSHISKEHPQKKHHAIFSALHGGISESLFYILRRAQTKEMIYEA